MDEWNLPASLPPPLSRDRLEGDAFTPRLPLKLLPPEPSSAPALEAEGRLRLVAHLRRRGLGVESTGPGTSLICRVRPGEAPEAFELELREREIHLLGGGEAGLHAGVETLSRLLRGGEPLPPQRWRDAPRHAWRGLLLDCARHSWSAPRLAAVVEELAAGRGNRLHLHLTDDQGWNLPLPGCPDLSALSTLSEGELRGLVALARELGVEILPEVDLPGHCGALLEARPELACPGRGGPRPRAWGCHEALLCLGNPGLPAFVDQLLDGLSELFPLGLVHLGGDEVPASAWEGCPRCRELIRREGLRGVEDLPGWWLRLLQPRLAARGLRGAFWDEALEAGAPPDALLFAWRGEAAVGRCLSAGHPTVACPQRPSYLDHYPGAEPGQPRAIGGWNSWQALRAFNPGPAAEAPAGLLGGQGNLWSEYLPTDELLQERLQPRLAALFEALWSGPRGAADFPVRLPDLLLEQAARGWIPRLDPPRLCGAPLALPGARLDLRVAASVERARLEWRPRGESAWRPLEEGPWRHEAPAGGARVLELRQRLDGLCSRPLELELRWEAAWPSREGLEDSAAWLVAPEPDWRRVALDPTAGTPAPRGLAWPAELVEERRQAGRPTCPSPALPWREEPATPELPLLAPWGAVRGLSRSTVVQVPADGVWSFALESHSLARLWLDGRLLLDHDGFAPAGRLQGWAPLAAGPHLLRLDWLDLRGGACLLEGPLATED